MILNPDIAEPDSVNVARRYMKLKPANASTHMILIVLATIILSACAPVTKRADVEDRVLQDPEQAYQLGAYREAARMWEQEAVAVSEGNGSRLRVRAMDSWVLAGDHETAANLRPWIEIQELSEGDASIYHLVNAEISLVDQNPVLANQELDRVTSSLPTAYSIRYETAIESVELLITNLDTQNLQIANQFLDDLQGYDVDTALALLKSLENVPSSQLALLANNDGDPERSGWLDLALVIRQNLVAPYDLENEMNAWESRHPGHAIQSEQALDLWLRYRQTFQAPERIAVLLPDSGRLKSAGAAVRDGIMNAYLSGTGNSEISFYDTGGNEQTVLAAYFEAADDGADWIIGPLDRSSIEALLGLAGFSTPILALNELPLRELIPAELADQIFGISLSQEKEAASVARHMTDQGLTRTLVLVPQNSWGDRIAQSFEENFLQSRGEMLITTRYLPQENDHSQVLEDILQISQSKDRKTRLENRLQMELEFEPVRRSDIDSIFLAATPEQGLQLKPQLRFFDVGNLPTYSTSRVFNGEPDRARNRDLNGLNLPMTSWQLTHNTPESIPEVSSLRNGRFAPLFAIGMDAWGILPWLNMLQNDPDFVFNGQSGKWSIGENGRLKREPYWGQIRSGQAVASTSAAR